MSEELETASATPSVTSSPQPLHNPSQAAVVQPPQAPLGSTNTGATALGAGQKALLAKKMAKGRFVSLFYIPGRVITSF